MARNAGSAWVDRTWRSVAAGCVLVLAALHVQARTTATQDSAALGVFVGSTPLDKPILEKLQMHVLSAARTLMIGNGGYSYTLNRKDHSEQRIDRKLARTVPDRSYQISPLESGPKVFGVFEGRSPCQGIARELKISVHAACQKAKWRRTVSPSPLVGHDEFSYTLNRREHRDGAV